MKQIKNWSALHFLASLGAGGMSVTFFMYLLFWVPHPGKPIPVFNDWLSYIQTASLGKQGMILLGLIGILVFGWFHFRWLILNFVQYRIFKSNGGVKEIIGTNAHTQLMAMPLTYAMSINICFIIAAIFIPGLWGGIEWLFPVSIMLFLIIGIWASRIYLDFFSHVLQHGSFDHTANNSLSQLLPSFAFAMIGVGLAAPAAMSHNDVVIGTSYLLSIFFTTGALFLGMIKLVIGMNDIFKQGVSRASLPTLWVVIPISTTAGIAIMRLSHGLHTLELGHGASNYILLAIIFSIQIVFFLMGWAVMNRMNYFHALLNHQEDTPVTFALICPGVAFVVMGHFVLNKVITVSGIISKFGYVYIGFSFLLIALQFITGWLLLRLAREQLKRS
ncbi:TsoY family (seleno)protein [Desulfosarcina widdelii]|uniref:TsoY family (seleno)protein n=1 Tax=Desulfosarcina widdelii TaxID=947919 RepID=UPI0012D2B7A5|nr:hypothetical protein [Desulfosarcina widdelii]